MTVRVETGSSEAMLRRLEEGRAETAGEKAPDWDVVFGIGAEVLEQGAEYWEPLQSAQADMIDKTFQLDGERENKKWAAFSARPLVIMYNTNVVTYRSFRKDGTACWSRGGEEGLPSGIPTARIFMRRRWQPLWRRRRKALRNL